MSRWRGVELVPVTSSHVAEIGHTFGNRPAGDLYVRFKGEPVGPLYVYDDVPRSVYVQLVEADADPNGSVGSLFNLLVKRNGYGCRRVE